MIGIQRFAQDLAKEPSSRKRIRIYVRRRGEVDDGRRMGAAATGDRNAGDQVLVTAVVTTRSG